MRKIITTLIITLIAGIIFTGIVLAETGTVNVPELNFREGASTSADTLGVLNNGTKVEIISEQGDWYKIRYNNKEGYVSKQYIKKDVSNNNANNNVNNTTNTTSENNITNNTNNANTTSTNTTNNNATTTNVPENPTNPTDISELNKTTIKQETEMYVLPLLNATKLGKINVGTKVLLISVNGDWAYIQTETQNAWIPAKKLESTKITLSSNIGATPTPAQDQETTSKPNETTTIPETTNTPTPEPTDTPTPSPTTTQAPTDNNSSTYPTTMYVNVDAVNIRKEPNTTSRIVTSAGKNVPVRVTAKEGDWYKVETSDGNGYIKAEFLSKSK